jgi:hypothetical protein
VELTSDKKHEPAQNNRRAYKEYEAINTIAKHAPGCIALRDAEDSGREQGKEHNRSKVRGLEH